MRSPPAIRTHLIALGGLLLLTSLSWLLTEQLATAAGLTAALIIAVCKSLIIGAIFMDLRGPRLRAALALLVVALLGGILIALVVGDVAFRPEHGVEEDWQVR